MLKKGNSEGPELRINTTISLAYNKNISNIMNKNNKEDNKDRRGQKQKS